MREEIKVERIKERKERRKYGKETERGGRNYPTN